MSPHFGIAAPPSSYEYLRALIGDATEIRSSCGAGSMVWRCWGGGPPLVLLHGGYGSWTHWIRNIPILATRYRIVAADLPGLGDSAMPPTPYTPESIAAILDHGLDQAIPSRERFHLVGFSFGALLGGHLAAKRGTQLRSLTLVGAASLGLPRGPTQELRPMQRRMAAAEIAELQRTNLAILMFADGQRIDDLAVYLQSENVARARVKSRKFAPTDALRRVLPQVAAPIGGIWGEYDVTAYPHLAARGALLREIQPDARFDIVPGAGHWVQYEAAEAFNCLLLDHLTAH